MAADPPHRRALVLTFATAFLGVALVVVPRIGMEPAPSSPPASVAPATFPMPSVDGESFPPATAEPSDATLLAVGDIGFCGGSADDAVADLAAQLPGTIALLGDIVYPDGSSADFADCFDPAWGPLRARIRPAPGNHDYQTRHASGYFSYFGAVAGAPGEGWYSYDLGAWHVIVLNSNCAAVGGCGVNSAQHAWLKADLEAHPAACTLAYWHHPRYSSGLHGDDAMTDPLWRALAAANADVVLNGHDHDYERFAPIDGIREFVVGTGGRSLYQMVRAPDRDSDLRANTSYGLLMLTLHDATFDWRFVPTAGSSLVDAGTAACR